MKEELGEISTTKSFSIKIKNFFKLEELAKEEKVSRSKLLDRMIEEY